MEAIKILAFAGSLRKDSYNKKLVSIAAMGAKEAGAEVTLVDLANYPMPIFNGDEEEKNGMPTKAKEFKELLKAHDGFLIASPEYNSSFTAALKNTIDWASRSETKEPALVAFAGKTAAILAASPGALGGLRGLVHLRAVLNNIQVFVIPDQIAIPEVHKSFSVDGILQDEEKRKRVVGIGKKLAIVTAKLKSE